MCFKSDRKCILNQMTFQKEIKVDSAEGKYRNFKLHN